MIPSAYKIIVVIPVFEDRIACIELLAKLFSQFGQEVFVVLVDDGSVRTPMRASDIKDSGGDGVVLNLCRNVGHQTSIAVGLTYVSNLMNDNQTVVIMDSDGEDSPEAIPKLLARLNDDVDAVVAVRGNREVSMNFKLFYLFYKLIFRTMTGKKISFGNFMLLTRGAVLRLIGMRELGIHLAATLLSSRLRFDLCRIDRGHRYHGASKMNFVTLALHGFRALMIFADDVLVRTGIFCSLMALFSLMGISGAILLKAFGFATPGWFSVALGILILILLQTGVLALITLVMTGNSRSNAPLHSSFYTDLIHTQASTFD